MKKSHKISLLALSAVLILLFLFCALSYSDAFAVSSIKVIGFETVPKAITDILKPYYGKNRFRINEKKLADSLRAIPIIKSAKINYAFPAKMSVTLLEINDPFVLTDGEKLCLLKSEKPHEVSRELVSSLSYEISTIEISPSYLAYLEKYGVDEDFKFVLSLLEEAVKAPDNLISEIKYDNNNSNDFGELVITLGSLNSELYVRARVSSKRIRDAIQVIKNETQNDKASGLSGRTVRYDLYQNAIVKSS